MKTAIIFSSKHGTTAKVALMLAEKLGRENITLINLIKEKCNNLNSYDAIILGTSIYAGRPIRKTKKFAKKNLKILKTKKIGLFICGMDPGEDKHIEKMKTAYSQELINHSIAKYYLGGEFIIEDMTFFERMIIKKIAHVKKSISLLHHENIQKFVEEFNEETEK